MNNYDAIPSELRIYKNWILWKYVPVENKKPTKVPYQINGYKADVTDAANWSTFDDCFNALSLGSYDGLGFVFTDTPFSGIDLDDPSFLVDGSPNPNYQSDLDRQLKVSYEFDSYSEVSPSGKGLHIFVKGKIAEGKKKNFIELYSSGRYFTITGKVHNHKPISEYQDLLTLLWTQMGGQSSPQIIVGTVKEEYTDEQIIERATNAINGDKFVKLLSGDWTNSYPSQSEADFAFIDIIAFYTQSKVQIARIFRSSALGKRPKAKRNDYVNETIAKSFDKQLPNVDIEGLKDQFHKKLNGHSLAPKEEILPTPTTPPGLLGQIAQFIYAAAPRPVPEVALAAAIGLMAGICGRAYNISGTGLNQYVLLLAMTGAGKEAAASGINKLMNTIKMQVPTSTSFIGPSEISSGAALFKYLGNQSQSFISLLGEFGLRLQQMSSPNANGSEVSLRRMFLDLYNKSGASETLHASVYSDKANNTSAVPSPSFSLLGESTPERFYGALNEDMISEGLLPRFLLIEYKGNRPPLNEQHAFVMPHTTLVSQLVTLAIYCDKINHSSPRPIVDVQATSEAAKLLHDFDKFADSKINSSGKEVVRQLWNRAHIKVLKLSALIAVGENHFNPTINADAMRWAADLVQADIAAITERFEAGEIGSNSFEVKQAQEIIRMIKDYALSPYDKVEKYMQIKVNGDKLHIDKVIPYVYIQRRLAASAAFRNDKAGATVAMKRAVQNLVDCDRIKELGKIWVNEKYGTSQRCFVVADLSIFD